MLINPCATCIDPGHCYSIDRCHQLVVAEMMGSPINDEFSEVNEFSELIEESFENTAVESLKSIYGDTVKED